MTETESTPEVLSATRLHEQLVGQPWYIAVGIGAQEGRPALYLYVTATVPARKQVGKFFESFPVLIQKSGQFKISREMLLAHRHLWAAPKRDPCPDESSR